MDLVEESDDLDVDQRVGGAQDLGPDLVMLSVAALLLAFVPEHRPQIPHLHRLGEPVQAMLDVRAHRPRGPFRPQGQLPPTLVVKDEHLLAHDVRGLPHAPDEKLHLLEDGQPYLRVVVPAEEVACDVLDPRPKLWSLVWLPSPREDVVGAPRPPVAHRIPKGKYGFVSTSSIAFRIGP